MAALEYAETEEHRHRKVERRYRNLFFVFQTPTIISAALATVFAVWEDAPQEIRAIPAAIATLGAAVLAAFPAAGRVAREGGAG